MASWNWPNSPTHSKPVSRRHGYLAGNARLRIGHRAPQIAAAHGKFHRHIAFLVFAIDEGGAAGELDTGEIGHWCGNRRAAGRVGCAHSDATDRVQAAAKLWRQAHHDRIVAVATRLIQIAGRLSADGCLDHAGDVAGCQTIAGGARPVDVYAHGGLAQAS